MDNVELLQLAVSRLADDKKNGQSSVADDDVLSRLILQLEALKDDDAIKRPKSSAVPTELHSPAMCEREAKSRDVDDELDASSSADMGTEELMKELKKVERQNSKTHWLLSIVIVLILGWQLSEYSLIMKVREGINHPFRSLGSMVMGMLKKWPGSDGQDKEKQPSMKKPLAEAAPLPLKIPEVPHMDFPGLGLNGEEQQ